MRKHLNPATAMSFIALVFATTGGAVAVTSHGGGNGGGYIHATAAKKKSKGRSTGKPGPRGPVGPKGEAGPAGSVGPAGPKGETGVEGKASPNGTNGTDGKNGESVISAALNPGEEGCAEGGSKFTVGGQTTIACNGEQGPEGKEGKLGPPGPFTKTLPEGETETGSWSTETRGTALSIGSIGFTLPLKAELSSEHVFFLVPGEEELVHCPGTAEVPRATAGNLCVYEAEVTGGLAKGFVKFAGKQFQGGLGASKSGAVVLQAPPESASESAVASSWGTWAVTAAEES